MKIYLFFLLISLFTIIAPKCVDSQNFCSKCNPRTDLCSICIGLDILTPDENGGCTGSKKCKAGKLYRM